MEEFTGDYYRCNNCSHIWDYMDICPNCGSDNIETINANEVNEHVSKLVKMLCAHGDYNPSELNTKALRLPDVVQQRELLFSFLKWFNTSLSNSIKLKYVDDYIKSKL